MIKLDTGDTTGGGEKDDWQGQAVDLITLDSFLITCGAVQSKIKREPACWAKI